MSESNERKMEFQSTFSPAIALQTYQMLQKHRFSRGRIMGLVIWGLYIALCIALACYARDYWWFFALLAVGFSLLRVSRIKRSSTITWKRAEEACPDGPKLVTYWLANDRLYSTGTIRDGILLEKFTAMYAADGVVSLVTPTQFFCFERKALSEEGWAALVQEIKAHNSAFKTKIK